MYKLLNLTTVAPLVLFYLLNFDLLNEEIQTLLHILAHSSMRHEPFFDIIEFMWRSTINLQLKSKIKQLERWMQKLLNCKSWNVWMSCWTFCRQSRRSFYLIYWTLIHSKIIFWKIILEHSCLIIKTFVRNKIKN